MQPDVIEIEKPRVSVAQIKRKCGRKCDQQQGRMSFALIPLQHARARVRRVAPRQANPLLTLFDHPEVSLSRAPAFPRVSHPTTLLLRVPRRRHRMRSRMPWPLTFKKDLRKAFESLLAARFRYRSRILRGLFDLRHPQKRLPALLFLCARRFAAVAPAFNLRSSLHVTHTRQNARILSTL